MSQLSDLVDIWQVEAPVRHKSKSEIKSANLFYFDY